MGIREKVQLVNRWLHSLFTIQQNGASACSKENQNLLYDILFQDTTLVGEHHYPLRELIGTWSRHVPRSPSNPIYSDGSESELEQYYIVDVR